LMLAGMHLTFGPMHVVGLEGQPRRMYRYDEGMGFDFWNMVETIGAFIIALSVLVFIWNVIATARSKVVAPADPWDARTLEWMTTNPPKPHNFDVVPTVHSVDEFWHRKYAEGEDHRMRRVATAEEVLAGPYVDPKSIHMPSPSWAPIVLSLGIFVMGFGFLYDAYPVAILGGLVLLGGIFSWILEPSAAPHVEHDDHDDHDHEHRVIDAAAPNSAKELIAGETH
jgi:cytochrome c oxidase subunit I